VPICPICDDTGLQNSDSTNPEFCYCAAGKQAKRQWDAQRTGNREKGQPKPASFIDIAQLEEVNASVDAMRASSRVTFPATGDESRAQAGDRQRIRDRPTACWTTPGRAMRSLSVAHMSD